MLFLYEVLFHIALVLGFPVLVLRPRLRERLQERIGRWDSLVFERLQGGAVVWIHCASVGEVQAAKPLLKRLFAAYPDYRFLITTMTVTGLKTAKETFGKQAAVSLLPLDSQLFLGRVFNRVTPKVVLIFETELWPRFLAMAKGAGAQVVLINGRISARSFPRYRKIKRFVASLVAKFDLLLMSGEDSAERIRALGAAEDKVRVLGNVKWAGDEEGAVARSVPGWPAGTLIFLAGSTHPGEEQLVLDAFEDLRQYQPQVKLLLAPRHPQRAAEVLALLKSRRLTCVTRTSGIDAARADVFVLDTVGELRSFFPVAQVVFLGGSLVSVGGHNVLEPAAAGVPVVYGPHMENFAEIAGAVEARGGALRVENWQGLARVLRELFPDPVRRRTMGGAGSRLVAENRLILEKYLEELRPVLGGGVKA